MNRTMRTTSVALMLAALFLLSSGCTRVDLREEGDDRSETIRLGSAEEVEVDLRMGYGDLTIEGGARKLMEGDFQYSDGSMGPEISYDVKGDVGELDIRQGDNKSWFGFLLIGDHYSNEWDILFDDDVPMTMDLELGAGDAFIDLSSSMLTDFAFEAGAGEFTVVIQDSETLEDVRLDAGAGDIKIDLSDGSVLRTLDVDAGAGTIEINLSGDAWLEDMNAQITAGAGDITVIVPEDIGVRVSVDTGIGDLHADGFRRNGGGWVNDSFGDSDVLFEIHVEQGVGSVRLKIE